MKYLEKIEQILKVNNVKYTLHKVPEGVGISVEEHIKAFGLEFSDGCATLIFKADAKFIALLRRDDTKIDLKSFKKLLGVSDLRIATPEELKVVSGFEVGLVSPIGLDLEMFMDSKVLEKETVRVGSGGNEFSLEIGTKDLLRITSAKVVDVCSVKAVTNSDNMRVLSGITPSSSKGLHLGNYLGAVKPHVEFQNKGECFYFIADYHALNTVFDKKTFANNVYETYLDYLALGIDTEKTVFFIESHIKGIFELTEILNNMVSLSQMKRMHAYKDKLSDPDSDIENINMGLFSYPILMSADILIFEPDVIPVGEDQTQHVEICRDIAKAFNNRYGNTLKVPELYVKESVARVPGTDGVRKMSKSLGNDITIFADTDVIKSQIMGITTDPNRIKANDPGDPEKNVIFKYMKLMDYDNQKLLDFEDQYKKGTIGDVALKNTFFEFFTDYFSSVRNKREEIAKDSDKVKALIKEHGEKANVVAEKTMKKVRDSIGAVL